MLVTENYEKKITSDQELIHLLKGQGFYMYNVNALLMIFYRNALKIRKKELLVFT